MLDKSINPAVLELHNSRTANKQISRLLISLRKLKGDSLIFKMSDGGIRASVLRQQKELAALPIKSEFYQPLRRWFIQRFCSSPGSPNERGAAPDPCIGFPIALRDRNEVAVGFFKESIVSEEDKTLLFELQEIHKIEDALKHFGVRKEEITRYSAFCHLENGLLLIMSPNVAHLRATTATVLSLSNGHYVGPLDNEASRRCATEFGHEDLIVLSFLATDEAPGLELISRYEHEWENIPRIHLLAGAFTHRLCTNCVAEGSLSQSDLLPHFEGAGCESCGGKGYHGYIGCQSVLSFQREELLAVLRDGIDAAIAMYLREKMLPLYFDSVLKVQSKMVPLLEFEQIFASGNSFAEREEFINLLEPPVSESVSDTLSFGVVTNRETSSVLLVEDDSDQRELMRFVLEAEGYRLYEAKNGREAVSILEEKQIDLVITDLMMPEMDGTGLLEHLKADIRFSKIPVLVLTALEEPEHEVKLLEAGVADFVTKTASRRVILSRIARLLR